MKPLCAYNLMHVLFMHVVLGPPLPMDFTSHRAQIGLPTTIWECTQQSVAQAVRTDTTAATPQLHAALHLWLLRHPAPSG